MTVAASRNMQAYKEADAMQESEAEDLKLSRRDFGSTGYNGRKTVAKKGKTFYNEGRTIAMQWAYHPDTKVGDTRTVPLNGKYAVIQATKIDDGYVVIKNYSEKEYDQYYAHGMANRVYGSSDGQRLSDRGRGTYFGSIRNEREYAKVSGISDRSEGRNGFASRSLERSGENTESGEENGTVSYQSRDADYMAAADPVTYDDDGNVIPLSERFNEGNEDIRYQIREEFYKEFDEWDGKDSNARFVVGTTSEAMKSVGIKDQEIVLRSGTVINKINKHSEITREIFKKIPELLEDPIIIQFSDAIDLKTKKPKYDSRITVLGELYADMDVDGEMKREPVLVSIELLPSNQSKTMVLDFSLITSAYGHAKLQRYLEENTILYINEDKKRTNNWLSLNRLQLPVGENQYGSIRRIAYVNGKVKVQNSNNATYFQKLFEKSGIVDEYGEAIDNDSQTLNRQYRSSSMPSDIDILIEASEEVDFRIIINKKPHCEVFYFTMRFLLYWL